MTPNVEIQREAKPSAAMTGYGSPLLRPRRTDGVKLIDDKPAVELGQQYRFVQGLASAYELLPIALDPNLEPRLAANFDHVDGRVEGRGDSPLFELLPAPRFRNHSADALNLLGRLAVSIRSD
ncbi:hypothetical protein [Paucibacter sp. Y2R2-4]|uniref:hypothetical protein n=1 Tax=Paucibacter sp. Y2R2-4 TaxID=2893553 RepID=UPI0021E51608|nr:hypothetical protein [Paucibacter sp. Y2R2-4]MCV2351109.1 hypothetical protein [Paucibacter sp. Y2R2-4]